MQSDKRIKQIKTKLLAVLFFAGSMIPGLLFAQFIQQGPRLIGSGSLGSGVDQGNSVAISSDGNTAVIGGYYDNSEIGAAWIFIRNGGVWTQQGSKLVGTGGIGPGRQGSSVAISADGNTVVIGGCRDNGYSGAIWIFEQIGGVWSQQGSKLVGTGSVGYSAQGFSVAISSDGNTVIEGGYSDNNYVGALWIFTRSGGVWSQQGTKLIGTGAVGPSRQGSSVSISSDGNTTIEGGYFDNDTTGAVWVFTRSGSVWQQQGSKFIGSGAVGKAFQGFSVSVSSDGSTAIEGGYFDNSNSEFSGIGAAWVFTRSGSIWTQQGSKLIGTDAVGNADQGYSVSISSDGNTAVVGGYRDNNYSGAAWIFTRSSGVWTQQGTKLHGNDALGNSGQGFSSAVSSDGKTVIIGGPGNSSLGAAWIFVNPIIGITPVSNETPNQFSLSQNYPNPFNPNTVIKFQVAGNSFVKLSIYDILGSEIETLVSENLKAGTYEADWNAAKYSSGVYFYKLTAVDFVEMRKMILVK